MSTDSASGSSMDWAKGVMNAKYSFAAEVSPGFYDGSGFIIKATKIPEIVLEIWTGIAAAVRAM